MFEYEKAYRQGEILFFKVKTMPKFYGKYHVIKDGAIREGEKEGHIHQLDTSAGQLTMFGEDPKNADTGTIEVTASSAKVEHPEHAPVDLPKGDYVVKVQKEATGKHSSASVKD